MNVHMEHFNRFEAIIFFSYIFKKIVQKVIIYRSMIESNEMIPMAHIKLVGYFAHDSKFHETLGYCLSTIFFFFFLCLPSQFCILY